MEGKEQSRLAVGVRLLGKGQLVSFTQLKIEQSYNNKKSKKKHKKKKEQKNKEEKQKSQMNTVIISNKKICIVKMELYMNLLGFHDYHLKWKNK